MPDFSQWEMTYVTSASASVGFSGVMSSTSEVGSVVTSISSVGHSPSVVCSWGVGEMSSRRVQCTSVCTDGVRDAILCDFHRLVC